jgi:hypothetical protein
VSQNAERVSNHNPPTTIRSEYCSDRMWTGSIQLSCTQRHRNSTKTRYVITSFSTSSCLILPIMKSITTILCLVAALVAATAGYNIHQQQTSFSTQCQHDRQEVSRHSFLFIMAGGLTAAAVGTMIDNTGVQGSGGVRLNSPVWAKDAASTKGTKEDPAFQACLSKCMYACTKPKGEEQKSRSECLPDCKQQCATNKSQLLRGEPIKGS